MDAGSLVSISPQQGLKSGYILTTFDYRPTVWQRQHLAYSTDTHDIFERKLPMFMVKIIILLRRQIDGLQCLSAPDMM